jgi:choline dehydrogenase-like flavoprotein
MLWPVFTRGYSSYIFIQVLGGDSAVNGLVWVRGPKEEYDAIEGLGSPGWNWNNFYAAMRKVICARHAS